MGDKKPLKESEHVPKKKKGAYRLISKCNSRHKNGRFDLNSGSFEVRRIREREKEGMGGPALAKPPSPPKDSRSYQKETLHCSTALHCTALAVHCMKTFH